MGKLKFIKIGLAITAISLLAGTIYYGLINSQQLTIVKLSNILFLEFLVFFSVGNLLYFKNKFWNQRPWEQEKKKAKEKKEETEKNQAEDKQQTDALDPENKGKNLLLISLPLLVISILITLF